MNNKNKQEKDEQRRRNIGQIESKPDTVSLAEERGSEENNRKERLYETLYGRNTENLEGAELVREELNSLNEYYDENYYDIHKLWKEYKKDPNKDIITLKPGNEADVYALREKDKTNVVKLTQWNAFTKLNSKFSPSLSIL